MPWNIKQVIAKEERVPKCPVCSGRLTISHMVNDVYLCTCGTIIVASWEDPPKKLPKHAVDSAFSIRSAVNKDSHPCNRTHGEVNHKIPYYDCMCVCTYCTIARNAFIVGRSDRHTHE